MKARLQLVSIHLVITLLFGAVLYLLVSCFWYPDFYLDLLKADVIFVGILLGTLLIGPLLSFVAYKQNMIKDLMVIITLQIIAFSAGAQLLYAERPVFLVFSVDRFVVVTANSIDFRGLSPLVIEDYLTKPAPRIVGAYLPRLSSIDEAIKVVAEGGDIEFQPKLYEPIAVQRSLLERKGIKVSAPGSVDAHEIRAYPLVNPKGDDVVVLYDLVAMKPVDVHNVDPWSSQILKIELGK